MASSDKKKGTLKILKNDPWLEPYADAILGRHRYAQEREAVLTGGKSLTEFADGHKYFGLHRTSNGWSFREWAPNATAIHLIGDFNQWQKSVDFKLKRKEHGIWEINLSSEAIQHGQLYKIDVEWNGGSGERIPAWAQRVVQDAHTRIFSAQVWTCLLYNLTLPTNYTVYK
jgi:1,4-alpha-glucan branching enzyme